MRRVRRKIIVEAAVVESLLVGATMREHGLYIFVFSAVYRWPSRSIRQMDVPSGGGGRTLTKCSRN